MGLWQVGWTWERPTVPHSASAASPHLTQSAAGVPPSHTALPGGGTGDRNWKLACCPVQHWLLGWWLVLVDTQMANGALTEKALDIAACLDLQCQNTCCVFSTWKGTCSVVLRLSWDTAQCTSIWQVSNIETWIQKPLCWFAAAIRINRCAQAHKFILKWKSSAVQVCRSYYAGCGNPLQTQHHKIEPGVLHLCREAANPWSDGLQSAGMGLSLALGQPKKLHLCHNSHMANGGMQFLPGPHIARVEAYLLQCSDGCCEGRHSARGAQPAPLHSTRV